MRFVMLAAGLGVVTGDDCSPPCMGVEQSGFEESGTCAAMRLLHNIYIYISVGTVGITGPHAHTPDRTPQEVTLQNEYTHKSSCIELKLWPWRMARHSLRPRQSHHQTGVAGRVGACQCCSEILQNHCHNNPQSQPHCQRKAKGFEVASTALDQLYNNWKRHC